MTIVDSILAWFAQAILNYLLGRAIQSVVDYEAIQKQDAERGKINDANTKAYEDAKTRADKIKASIALLNRESP